MKRGPSGEFEPTRSGEKRVRAFVPKPLPPQPPLELTAHRARRHDRAPLACAVSPGHGQGAGPGPRRRQRDRVFAYSAYLAILNEGAEPL